MIEREYKIGMKQLVLQWRPGTGPDETALARMRDTFPRPSSLMGEAWFMGEKRHMFTDLMGDLDTLPVNEIQKPLEEIAGGTSSFGPLGEWHDWFHYLLPRLAPRATEHYVSTLIEELVTAFMSQYPCGVVDPPYSQFREDALNTLGRAMMNPACWRDGRIVIGSLLHRTKWPNGQWGWYDASGDLSASMFFNLKYLSPEEIPAWIASILAIACPYWRAQLLVWFVGAHDVLERRIEDPSGLPDVGERDGGGPAIGWSWAHCLKMGHLAPGDPAPFFPRANCQAILEGLAETMNDDLLLQWLLTITEVPELDTELLDVPRRFQELYL